MLRPFFAALLSLSTLPAATLFSQPAGNNGLISSAPTNLMGGLGNRAFDNFSLLAGATVNEVVWWGMFSKSLPNFEISIFQGGIYGPPIWTSSHASVQKQIVTSGISMERYSVILPNPFVAPTSGEFFLSIFHHTPSVPGGIGWGWVAAALVGDSSQARPINPGDGSLGPPRRLSSDLAFELNEVPEPSYYALIALCLIAGAWTHHHRSHLHRALAPRVKSLPRRDRLV